MKKIIQTSLSVGMLLVAVFLLVQIKEAHENTEVLKQLTGDEVVEEDNNPLKVWLSDNTGVVKKDIIIPKESQETSDINLEDDPMLKFVNEVKRLGEEDEIKKEKLESSVKIGEINISGDTEAGIKALDNALKNF